MGRFTDINFTFSTVGWRPCYSWATLRGSSQTPTAISFPRTSPRISLLRCPLVENTLDIASVIMSAQYRGIETTIKVESHLPR